jgi:predicted amidohydrolase
MTCASRCCSRIAEADADVISVPAAFTVPTGMAHWHTFARATIEARAVRRRRGPGQAP